MSQNKILIVDDEKELAEVIRDYLLADGFQVELAYTGEQGKKAFEEFDFDLIILDIMLPGLEGTDLCKIIRRKSDVPIIMLSAKCEDSDKVLSLGLGADNYLTKPCSPSVVIASVKALLRRETQERTENSKSSPAKKENIISYKNLRIDKNSFSVFLDGEKINLAAKEFELLSYLAANKDKVFSKEQLLDQIWGINKFYGKSTVTVHISKIREKIEEDPSNPEFIQTVWGVGYKFGSE